MIRETLVAVLIGLGVAAAAFIFTHSAFPLVVYYSWSTLECVSVEPASAGSCEGLPYGFDIVWVQ